MALDIKTKLGLQKEASQIKKDLAITKGIREKLTLQKRWSIILKQLKGKVDDNGNDIDKEANQAATGDNGKPEPTEKQKESGEYDKGLITISGLEIEIENPKGSTRSGESEGGTKWSITMNHHYGDIKGTIGADDDPVDVFIGNDTNSNSVFVIDQVFDGQFDEHKVMLGFKTMADAKKAYLSNYESDWQGLGDITQMDIEKFKAWVFSGKKTNPAVGIHIEKKDDFLDLYQEGEFNDREPLAFSELSKQAADEGLDLNRNKEVVTNYINSNEPSLMF